MLTVACVLKSGGIYDASWVARLKAGVAQHLPEEHRFVCLSDVDVPCERIPLRHDWPGWWAKIEALRLDGPALVIDLDTAIVGDLTQLAIVARHIDFGCLRDFYRPEGLGSGIMAWSGDDPMPMRLYDQFLCSPHSWMAQCGTGGDQAFIEANAPAPYVWRLQDPIPGQIVSYKIHCRAGIPPDARAICLHGFPKFRDMAANDPVRVAWERAA